MSETKNVGIPIAGEGATERGEICRVQVLGPRPHDFVISRNSMLLKSVLEQGVAYPHNCRVGVCGSCKTRIVSGRVSPMVDLALSPLSNEEIRSGYVLACQAKVRGDLQIEVRLSEENMLPVKTVSGRITSCKHLPGGVLDVRLRLDEALMYRAGQYCTIAASGSFVRRSYSFYDAPPDPDGEGARDVGFLIKRLPGGRFSEWLFEQDRSGAKMWLEGPIGMMGFEEIHRDGLCVAGGTGIAPVLSIVADRLTRSKSAKFTIVFGVRRAQDRFAEAYLKTLQARAPDRVQVITILSGEPKISSWTGLRGQITEALGPGLNVDFSQVAAFVCGGLPMVEAVERRLLSLGVDSARIHADKFIPTT